MFDDAALTTDLYQLTMMQGYWAHGKQDQPAAFELFFRSIPERGGYCIAAGIEIALEILQSLRFQDRHLDYLATLGLFRPEFLDYLRTLRFRGSLRALPEGSLVFPREPILEVVAPLVQAQWVETVLLNCINYQTLIATKASRIVRAAAPATCIEFGLRRAHGPMGGLWVARAAYVGGCIGTSNVEAGWRYGIPIFGTHAHSWIQSFDDEPTAFRAYTETFPDSSLLLLDTYDTLAQGLPHAIAEGLRLKAQGHRLKGVRLDSGDLAELSKACRNQLDAAGLPEVTILASGDIDEYALVELKRQLAPIDSYGVGTRLATAFGEPSLNGVYKLVAIREGDRWTPRIKVSATPAKTILAGRKQIWRACQHDKYVGDLLTEESQTASDQRIDVSAPTHKHPFPAADAQPLLVQRLIDGQPTIAAESLAVIRQRVMDELQRLADHHARMEGSQPYPVGVSPELWNLSQRAAQAARS